MTANRSLDEFADAGSEEAESVDGPDDVVAEGTTVGAADESTGDMNRGVGETVEDVPEEAPDPYADGAPEAVSPAASTYAWSPEGGPCAACGERVEERWREGDDLVCGDCKEW